MGTIKIDLEEQFRWYYWYLLISNRYPNASKGAVIKKVNEIVYKKQNYEREYRFNKNTEGLSKRI